MIRFKISVSKERKTSIRQNVWLISPSISCSVNERGDFVLFLVETMEMCETYNAERSIKWGFKK